jgi:predicted XRE-type DNA-binding protein
MLIPIRGGDMKNIKIHKGSGNVYQDLGFYDAEEMQAKAALASGIISIIQAHKWTQEKAALMLGIPQPKISKLARGQFSGFSLGKLLNKLNQDVEIVVKNRRVSKNDNIGHVSVVYGGVC